MNPPSTSRLRRLLRHVRGLVLTVMAITIIVTAVLVGVGRALIPYADQMRPWLASTLSHQIEQEVRIERLEVQWPRLTPQLILFGSSVGPETDPLVEIGQARLELHLPDLFRAERNPFRLIVVGLEVVLAEDENGHWGVELEGGGRVGDRPGRDQVLAGDLLVRDARLRVRPADRPEVGARLVEGEIQRRGDQTFIQGLLEPAVETGAGIDFRLLLSHPGNHWQSVRAWAAGNELVLDQWLTADWLPPPVRLATESRVSLEAWLDVKADGEGRLDLDLALSDAGLGAEAVEAELLFSRQDRRIQAELVRLQESNGRDAPLLTGLALGRSGSVWGVVVDYLDLEGAYRLFRPWLEELDRAPDRLAGEVRGLRAEWRPGIGLHALTGHVEGLSAAMPDPLPTVDDLDVRLMLAGDRVVLEPDGRPHIDWPGLLRGAVDLDRISGRVLLSPGAIELQQLRIGNAALDGWADGWIYLGAERPFLDLVIEAERVENIDPRPYLPPQYIPAPALQWLDAALSQVGHAEGVVVLHLRTGTPATDIQPGHFQAEVEFADIDIDYWPDWPIARGLHGEVQFIGTGLHGRVNKGRLGPVDLAAPRLSLADLNDPVLELELVSGQKDAAGIAALVASLPIPNWDQVMAPMEWTGPVAVTTRLSLPFSDMDNWWMDGEVNLQGTGLTLPALALTFRQLDGVVGFDRDFLGPAQVQAVTERDPARQLVLDLNAGFAEPAWLRLESEFNPALLASDEAATVAERIHGASRFRIDLSGDTGAGLQVKVRSDLQGLALDLPAPLAKTRAERWPMELDVALGDQGVAAGLDLAGWLHLQLATAPGDWRLGLGLNRPAANLPSEQGFRVRGHLDRLDFTEWMAVLAGQGGAASPLQADVALRLGQLEVSGLAFEDVGVVMARENSAWQVDLASELVDGRLTLPIPIDSGRGIVADLRRLHLEPLDPAVRPAELDVQPLSRQTSTLSPRGLPPLHLLVEDLRWGDLNLGRARLESHAVADGVEIELADVSGPDLRLHGRGRWVERDQRTHGEFQGRLTTGNLSGLLASAGYDSGLDAAHAQIDASVRWPGAPTDFALSRLSGEFELQIQDGTIPEARPGAGRLLGLASFNAIPRRLMLDFRDVFSAGLKFDEIQGRFDLAAGFARTSGLVIQSPAATITISGDTDMAARQYDQVIVVEPGLGATLPLIGGLAGGPVGAAAGLVLRTLLERPLRGIAEARYSVTGSWDEPLIELIEARVTDEDGAEAVVVPEPATQDGS